MTEKKKIKVMFYADTFTSTSGYSKVGRELALRLAKMEDFDIYFQELVTQEPARNFNGVKILPSFATRGTKEFLNVLVHHLRIFSPQIFFPISDTFLLKRDGIDKLEMKNIKLIPYIMIDSEGLPDYSEDILKYASKIYSGSKHGADTMINSGFNAEVLFHGVDPTHYKPIKKDLMKLKRKDNSYPEDKKIFLFVGRNFLRKRPQRLLEAIAIYNTKNPDNDAHFIFHSSGAEIHEWNLPLFVKRLKKQYNCKMNNVEFTEKHNLGTGIDEVDLVSLYQLSDFYISASSGEGFGLPIVEAMACKKVVIAPDNTTHSVFLDDGRGILVKNEGYSYTGYGTKQKLPDTKALAESIEKAMNMNLQEYDKMSNAGMAWTKENCNWDTIAKQLADGFREVKND